MKSNNYVHCRTPYGYLSLYKSENEISNKTVKTPSKILKLPSQDILYDNKREENPHGSEGESCSSVLKKKGLERESRDSTKSIQT
ncbi:hypothetical protein V6N12_020575 [Hibiscus sabdariffa]|uniref:Uncharacterized protein n=1 Tax=Hibiscus sabdariffa TaxID=183260 RepID=A0ABR2D155_9ROSI